MACQLVRRGDATADPKPEMLVQFGQLGVAYAQLTLGVPAPRVGLLTIGTEPPLAPPPVIGAARYWRRD